MTKFLLSVLAVLGLTLVTGCKSGYNLQGVSIFARQIERSADGSASVTILYTNPNVVAYNIDRATHKIFLNGQFLGTAEQKDPLGIAPQSSATQVLPLQLEGTAPLNSGQQSCRLESSIILRLYGDDTDRDKRESSGTVAVVVR